MQLLTPAFIVLLSASVVYTAALPVAVSREPQGPCPEAQPAPALLPNLPALPNNGGLAAPGLPGFPVPPSGGGAAAPGKRAPPVEPAAPAAADDSAPPGAPASPAVPAIPGLPIALPCLPLEGRDLTQRDDPPPPPPPPPTLGLSLPPLPPVPSLPGLPLFQFGGPPPSSDDG